VRCVGGNQQRLELLRRIRLSIVLFTIVVAVGIAGYMAIEGWPFKDALYMTIITVTTVGYREVNPLTSAGQYFTIFIALAGVGTAFYLFVSTAEFMIEGHLKGFLAVRKLEKEIARLDNHYILCGFGRVGENVAGEFKVAGERFVIIENNPERVEDARSKGYLCIEGDASSDEILIKAGVERARGLVAAVDSDADNVFVTLTARVLNPGINIVARAILEESKEKLIRAGANKVVSPSRIGGKRIASIMLRPLVTDYLDVVTSSKELEFSLEELIVSDTSKVKGMTIEEANIRKRTGAVILAIRKRTGEFNTAPSSKTILDEGDHLVVLGTRNQLEAIQNIV